MINKEGLAIIKRYEGLKLHSYYCPARKLTIGYGHTGPDVKSGMQISENMAELLLMKDCERFEKGILELVKVRLTENQLSALICFTFNVGREAFRNSTMLRLINERNITASDEFLKWVHAGGQVLPGLVSRRKSERELFLKQ